MVLYKKIFTTHNWFKLEASCVILANFLYEFEAFVFELGLNL